MKMQPRMNPDDLCILCGKQPVWIDLMLCKDCWDKRVDQAAKEAAVHPEDYVEKTD